MLLSHAMDGLDPRVCYRALETRDARFDGRLFVGVTSTAIYCRPVCPAGPAKFENCRFYLTAAAAQEDGFRPCLRCRPETAPDVGSWRGTSNTVSRGLALIAEGALDGDEASVDALAARLGVGGRHLRRLFMQHLGASPVTVAQTRRVLFAKQLLHDTRLPMTEVALAAGFGSLRRFNETFQRLFHRPPSALRRKPATAVREGSVAATGVTVRLRYRPPYDWPAMLHHLRTRAIDGVERVDAERYARTVVQDGGVGTIEIVHLPAVQSLAATIRIPCVRALPRVVERIRRLFDLGADVAAIDAQLARDPLLAPLIAARPGLRAPGSWDGFECAVRAVLDQRVSPETGRELAGRLARACGARVPPAPGLAETLTHTFPAAGRVAGADPTGLGVPASSGAVLVALARAVVADPTLLEPLGAVEKTVTRLRAIPGIDGSTAHQIALVVAREPDAFSPRDGDLLRAVARNGTQPTPAAARRHAERWRPWRGYAAQHLRIAYGGSHG
jgi:AraC family transcriptional regulator, regulatory protein of adaptative response / DNA-3-methyladenine glycosylase II